MTPERRAREFVEVGFRDIGVPSLEPYIAVIADLLRGAVEDEREACAKVAEDREGFWRGETIAKEIRSRLTSGEAAKGQSNG